MPPGYFLSQGRGREEDDKPLCGGVATNVDLVASKFSETDVICKQPQKVLIVRHISIVHFDNDNPRQLSVNKLAQKIKNYLNTNKNAGTKKTSLVCGGGLKQRW